VESNPGRPVQPHSDPDCAREALELTPKLQFWFDRLVTRLLAQQFHEQIGWLSPCFKQPELRGIPQASARGIRACCLSDPGFRRSRRTARQRKRRDGGRRCLWDGGW